MLKQIIEDCFAELKSEDASNSKKLFGYIWAVFASKRVRFTNGNIFLSWRELSAQLAIIYSEWYNCSFTTDAFLNVVSPDKSPGDNKQYDDILMQVYRHKDCIGIFNIKVGTPIRAETTMGISSEVDVVTGEEHYYQQEYAKGNCVGNPKRISAEEYEKFAFSMK